MKNLLLLLPAAFILLAATAFAQSNIKMSARYGSENVDLQSILQFENIGLNKLEFTGGDLKNRDFQISIKEFVKGRLTRSDVVFDSREDAYFKIKSERFVFRVLTKTTSENTVKFDFQFDGFSKAKEYKVAAGQKEFALKTFLGSRTELSIPLNTNTYILTYMMPYVRNDGSKQYCEVVQAGVAAEELGTKYAIPRYFLIDIKFQ
jgi:hypothetical protein